VADNKKKKKMVVVVVVVARFTLATVTLLTVTWKTGLSGR
jgi:hypothetical protein